MWSEQETRRELCERCFDEFVNVFLCIFVNVFSVQQFVGGNGNIVQM